MAFVVFKGERKLTELVERFLLLQDGVGLAAPDECSPKMACSGLAGSNRLHQLAAELHQREQCNRAQ